MRLHAALMLKVIGHRRGVPVLAKVAVDDKSPAVRAAAAAYLGKVGVKDRRAVGALAKVLEDKVPAVRISAVEALGFLQLAQTIPILKKALEDKNTGVRIRATEVLGHVLSKDF